MAKDYWIINYIETTWNKKTSLRKIGAIPIYVANQLIGFRINKLTKEDKRYKDIEAMGLKLQEILHRTNNAC